jgi:hypothetical protein
LAENGIFFWLDLILAQRGKSGVMDTNGGPNYRFIFTIAVLLLAVLLAVAVIWIGYEQARHHAIGNNAPISALPKPK